MQMKKIFSAFIFLFMTTAVFSQHIPTPIQEKIDSGEFTKAQQLIKQFLDDDTLSASEKEILSFESERFERIKKDFTKTGSQVLAELEKMLPEFSFGDLTRFEVDKSLEMKIIDGEKRYFKNAAANLFRINKKLKKLKEERFGTPIDKLTEFKKKLAAGITNESITNGNKYIDSQTIKINYTLTVKPNVVPAGEIIRCWLPYPKENHPRQQRLKLIGTSEEKFILAPDSVLQRTIYMEKKAEKDSATVFSIECEFTTFAEYNDIFSKSASIPDDAKLNEYLAERPPHIVFTDELKALSKKIIGDETLPLEKVKKIFTWIHENIPWASALEYSTIPNISEYCLENLHGDCGIKTLLFMALCRYNGIPAKWQSGWMLHPVEVNLHDWCEIFVEPFGWVPVDQSFGLINSENEKEKYFYLGSTDAYHLIINDDYSQPLFPVKIFPRSETVDFQRGEVEWRGGNLYFDRWNYNMEVSYSKREYNEK